MGQLSADDVEDWEDGLGEGGGVLRARGVAQLQLGEVTQPGHRRQHHQVQVAVVEAEHFIGTINIELCWVSHNIGSTLFFDIFSGSGAHTEELLTIFQQPWKFAI